MITRRIAAFARGSGPVLLAAALVAPALAAPASMNEPRPDVPALPSAAPGDRGSAIMSAAIDGAAVILQGEGVVSAARLSSGQFEVRFGRDVTACVYTASPRLFARQTVIVQPRFGDPSGVFVAVFDGQGSLVDNAFNLIVYCGR